MAPPQLRQQTPNRSLLLVYRLWRDERLSWPRWLTYSGWLTHTSGHPSATGREQDSESSMAKDRHSTAGPRNQRGGGRVRYLVRSWTLPCRPAGASRTPAPKCPLARARPVEAGRTTTSGGQCRPRAARGSREPRTTGRRTVPRSRGCRRPCGRRDSAGDWHCSSARNVHDIVFTRTVGNFCPGGRGVQNNIHIFHHDSTMKNSNRGTGAPNTSRLWYSHVWTEKGS